MADPALDLLDAKLALEQELGQPLFALATDYISRIDDNGGRPLPLAERLQHLERLEAVLRRHYCRVAMVVTGRRPPSSPSVNEAALSLRHMESMILRARAQALLILSSIDRDIARELARVTAPDIPDDAMGHPVAYKAWVAGEIKADKNKVTGVTAGMIGRFRARINAITNVNTNAPAEEARMAAVLDDIDLVRDGERLVQVWNSLLDGRERPAHHEAHGQERPIDQPFSVGGARLRFPGDTGLGAPLSLTINCRCFLTTYAVDSDGNHRHVHTGTSAPARRQRRRGDRVGPGERMPATPTSVVTLNGRTRATVVLGNGQLATMRQETPTSIVVRVGRRTVARASTSGGTVTSIQVDRAWQSSGVEALIRRSVAHSANR